MAVAVNVTIYGIITGLQSGQKIVGPYTVVTIPNAPNAPTDLTSSQTTVLTLGNGDNTIAIPSTFCVAAIVSFAAGSTTTKKLKGAAPDTGITLNATGVNVISFPGSGTTGTSFIINSSAIDTGFATEILFI